MSQQSDIETNGEQQAAINGQFGIEFRRPVTEDVTGFYDLEVSAPLDASRSEIRDRAAENVADAVDGITAAELDEAHQWLEAIVFDGELEAAVPSGLETITFTELVRYQHDGSTCEGQIFDVDQENTSSLPTLLILVTTIGDEQVEGTEVHKVPVTDVTACLDENEGQGGDR
jgi:hypothetical protein